MNRVDWDVYPYDSNIDDECLCDTLGDTDYDVKSIFERTIWIKLFSHTSTLILSRINLMS